MKVRGRSGECEALDGLLADVRAGRSAVLVLRGEAGIGKTALLEYLLRRASGCRIARSAGVESETQLAFGGLHQLCAPFLDRLGGLPAPQRQALGAAFGLTAGEPPDRFLVGLAVLNLLSGVAQEQPLVCLVDDAQWLDRVSAQTLGFVARRLGAQPLALAVAVRGPGDDGALAGLQELEVRGLGDDDARALLASVLNGPIDDRVLDRMVAETRGNPLALLDVPRGRSPAELAGGFAVPDTKPETSRLEQGYLRRLRPLPVQTRRLLLTAAAEPLGDATLLWRAADRLGVGADAAAADGAAELIEIGVRVRFRHPLVRAAAYRTASAEERRIVHEALAEVTDPDLDADRRAWHMAQATPAPDEEVAAQLERSAGRAQARGGIAAAAAFLERAVGLTPDPARRARRALAAGQAKHQAGAPDAARALLAIARAGPLDERQCAQVDLVEARIAATSSDGEVAPAILLRAAERLEPLDVGLARTTYLEALAAARSAARPAADRALREVARAARAAPPSTAPQATDLLLDGLAIRWTEGYPAAAPVLRNAVAAFRSPDLPAEHGLRWLWLAAATALELWDDEAWEALAVRNVELARRVGALTVLPTALSTMSAVRLSAGNLREASALVEEATAVSGAVGSRLGPSAALGLAAARGRETEARALADAALLDAGSGGRGTDAGSPCAALALLHNSLGRPQEALVAAERAGEPADLWAQVELIEAAARTEHRERAHAALERLAEATRASGTDWALGIEARSRALLSEGRAAEEIYREAIDRLGRTRARRDAVRARLLFGEWLSRENRRPQAREELRAAREAFVEMGAEGFAERARRELAATGEAAPRRNVGTPDELTAQEAQVARLVAEGHTNPEVGAELFISARTVEWHLRKVFAKLGVGSRRELRAALSAPGRAPAAR